MHELPPSFADHIGTVRIRSFVLLGAALLSLSVRSEAEVETAKTNSVAKADSAIKSDFDTLKAYVAKGDWGTAVEWLAVGDPAGKLQQNGAEVDDEHALIQEGFLFNAGQAYEGELNSMKGDIDAQKRLGAPEAFAAWKVYLDWTLKVIQAEEDEGSETLQKIKEGLDAAVEPERMEKKGQKKAGFQTRWERRINTVLKSLGQATNLTGKWGNLVAIYAKVRGKYHYINSLDKWEEALGKIVPARPQPMHRKFLEDYADALEDWASAHQSKPENRFVKRAGAIRKTLLTMPVQATEP